MTLDFVLRQCYLPGNHPPGDERSHIPYYSLQFLIYIDGLAKCQA
ncbi:MULTISPECIES: hypothetical protein [unclassified Coleofasciculus]|nr:MULTISPECIES: hypothetical protein [unclassified Coleofasciculus]